jgi:DNA-binding CsgD family transcriptional regulator/tetratricopeptide (TPR) repeat protein
VPGSVRLVSEALVGRGKELRSALTVLHHLPDGRPGVVAVGGPAGIGKTRFVTALAERLRSDRVRVLLGSCLDLHSGAPPYAALIAALRSVDPPAVQLLDALTGAVAMRRSRLFELLRTTVVGTSRRRPTVLIVENIHWLDRITRDALLYLAAMAREGRWALVVTYRSDDAAARPAVPEFLDQLDPDVLAHITLEALSPPEVAAQAAAITGAMPSPEHAARLYARTGGIPLLVEEVLAAEAAGVTGVPDHLRDLFLARVGRLGARAARAVEVVAVSGERSDERLVARVLSTGPTAAAAALDRAALAGLLVADGTSYRMRHELLREAVYDALPAARRRHLHATLAAVLAETAAPDVAALAHHWYQAAAPARAAATNLEAAAVAERVHAPAEVRTYLQRVLEHFDALPADRVAALGGRAGLLARAAEAAYLSGAFAPAVELSEECLTGTDAPQELAVRWERLARYRWVGADGPGAAQAHQRSIDVLPADAPPAVRAQVLAGYAWYLTMSGRAEQARAWSERAVAAADASGEQLDRCRALLAWGWAHGDRDAGLAALRQARDLAVRCDAPDELGRAHAALDLALRRPGGAAEREEVLRAGLGHAAAHGLGGSYARVMTSLLGELLLQVGRWDEAGDILAEITVGANADLPAMFALSFQARLAAGRGDPSTVGACVDRVATMSEGIPQQPYPVVVAWCALAESRLWEGDAEPALATADRARAVATDPVAVSEADLVHARAAADLAEQARRLGRTASGRADHESYRVFRDDHPLVGPFRLAAHAELARGDGSGDPDPWRDAAAAWDDVPDPYRAAYCRWRLAQALLTSRTGRQGARRALDAAHATVTRLRARPLQEGIESLASTARVRLGRDSRPTGPAAVAAELQLTHRELEIVPYLVAGRTNAEIARALVISPRTVGVHVSRILRKLGAARRAEAADIARRRGLISG